MSDQNKAELIRAALGRLDTDNDDQWTGDGAPLVDVVRGLMPEGASLTRKEITDAAPNFSRETPKLAEAPAKAVPETVDGEPARADAGGAAGTDVDEGVTTVQFEAPPEDRLPKTAPPLKLPDINDVEADQLVETLEAAREAAADAERVAVEARARAKQLQDFVDKLIERSEVQPNHRTNQLEIMSYIAKSNANRAQQGERLARLRETFGGVDPAEVLNPTAPIDRAMARKTARGTERPNRPVGSV